MLERPPRKWRSSLQNDSTNSSTNGPSRARLVNVTRAISTESPLSLPCTVYRHLFIKRGTSEIPRSRETSRNGCSRSCGFLHGFEDAFLEDLACHGDLLETTDRPSQWNLLRGYQKRAVVIWRLWIVGTHGYGHHLAFPMNDCIYRYP